MHRFYLPPEQCHDKVLVLTGREAHHALHVLRLQPNDRVAVLDGVGHNYTCEVQGCERDSVRLKIIEKTFVPPLPYQLTLLQALPKGKLIEFIIQKATELGAFRIVPLLSERVVRQLDNEACGRKTEKWQLAAIEAIKQCGSTWLPLIEPPVSPAQLLASQPQFELSFIGSLQPDAKHPRQHFQDFVQTHARRPKSVAIWIGPEGDFTLEELNAIQLTGARPMSLGPLVLRADTAAVSSLAILNYELQAPA